MTDVVNPDTLNACFFCTSVHLTVKIALCNREHPVIWLNAIKLFQIVLHFLCEELRHFYDAVAFLGFGRCDQILPIQALIGFCDLHGAFFKIKICGCQRQKFSFADAAPVEHFEGVKG